MKLLITSVGSLVGQGILDVLECPGRSRRGLVTVIGTNSLGVCAAEDFEVCCHRLNRMVR